jgi:hypothetical protein
MRSGCSDSRVVPRVDQQSYVESGVTSLTSDVRAAGFLRITADWPKYALDLTADAVLALHHLPRRPLLRRRDPDAPFA